MSEKLLLERVTAAAEERHLSQNTLTAYRRTWIKAIAWAAAEGLALETLPSERAGGILLERVTAAAEERQFSHNSLIAYRRTWLKIIAWAAAEGLVLETFPVERG